MKHPNLAQESSSLLMIMRCLLQRIMVVSTRTYVPCVRATEPVSTTGSRRGDLNISTLRMAMMLLS